MLNYDPVSGLRHYPIQMGRFGTNPYGENLYRIVFGPSRRHIVFGEWPDGSKKAQYSRKYFQVGNQWIMERWLPPAEYAKCSREVWNRDYLILGPYPDRGEYEICHTFDGMFIEDISLDKLVMMIEEGRKRTLYEKTVDARNDSDRERAATDSQLDACIRDKLCHITGPTSGYGGGRSEKSKPIRRSAKELGLPTHGGASRSKYRPNRPTFEVPLSVA